MAQNDNDSHFNLIISKDSEMLKGGFKTTTVNLGIWPNFSDLSPPSEVRPS